MKKMRVRKWLAAHKNQEIFLNNAEAKRIGQQNIVKLLKISRRHKKQIHINVQPKLNIHDEAHLMFTGVESTRTNLNKPNVEVTQTF